MSDSARNNAAPRGCIKLVEHLKRAGENRVERINLDVEEDEMLIIIQTLIIIVFSIFYVNQ